MLRDDAGEPRVAAERRHVVHELGAELERALRHADLLVSIETATPASPSSTGTTRRSSSSSATGAPRTRRLAADVDERGALGREPPSVGDRVGGPTGTARRRRNCRA